MLLEEKCEGLVLRGFAYKDRQKIVTLFTPTKGLLSLIVKGIHRKAPHLLTLTSPFTQAEYFLRSSSSSLYRFHDATLIDPHSYLRNHLLYIEAAATFAKALLSTQMPGKPSFDLYRLTLLYLKLLLKAPPATLMISYLLKLLKYEGYLDLHKDCTLCKQPASCIGGGESYCALHSQKNFYCFTKEEWQDLQVLTHTKNIEKITLLITTDVLKTKIQALFSDHVKMHCSSPLLSH